MGQLISVSIDLSKIDKSKIVEGKNGAKYYNMLISVNDTKNQYGQDVSISENQSKEERESGAKKNYLGNGKTIWSGTTKQPAPSPEGISEHSTQDDLPF
jgi:DNA-binding protein H-NS